MSAVGRITRRPPLYHTRESHVARSMKSKNANGFNRSSQDEVGFRDEAEIEEFDRRRASQDNTDDPVRMYLMQMGQIPLLTRAEEISSAMAIESSREKYRHSILATDYVLQGAVHLLEQVRDGGLRLDRTIEVSVTNTAEKKRILKRLGPNLATVQHLLKKNHNDYRTAISIKQPMSARKAAWRRLVIRRNKAVRRY